MFWLTSWSFDLFVPADNLRSSVAVCKCSRSEQHKRKFLGRQKINEIPECTRLAEVENAEPIAS